METARAAESFDRRAIRSATVPVRLVGRRRPGDISRRSCETLIAALAGKVAYREAVSGLEKVTTGIVAKRAASRYVAGRSREWLKIKTKAWQAVADVRFKHL